VSGQSAVAAVGILVQRFQILDDAGTQGVQMDIANQFQKVWIFLAQDGFIPVLKQAPMAFMPVIETDCVAGQKPAHNRGDGNVTGSQKKVEMIGDQRPGVTKRFTVADNPGQALDEIIAIIVIEKKLSPFYPPADDMVQLHIIGYGNAYFHPRPHFPTSRKIINFFRAYRKSRPDEGLLFLV
jgi:hypothetical protein